MMGTQLKGFNLCSGRLLWQLVHGVGWRGNPRAREPRKSLCLWSKMVMASRAVALGIEWRGGYEILRMGGCWRWGRKDTER